VIGGYARKVARRFGLLAAPSAPASKARPARPLIEWQYPKDGGSFNDRDAILRELLALFQPGRLIDLACGNGMYSITAHDLGWEVTGVDARTVRMPTTPGITWIQQDIRETDVSGFDVVLLMGLLYHLELDDQLSLLRRCAGSITILDTHHSTLPTHLERGYAGHTFHEVPAGREGELADMPTAAWGNLTAFWPTQPDLVRMLRDCGYGTVLARVPPTLPNRTFYLCLPNRAAARAGASGPNPAGVP